MKLALFDCDGTLVDSQLAIVSAMTTAWLAFGLVEGPDPAEVRRLAALPLTEAITIMLPGQDAWKIKRLSGLCRDALYQRRHSGNRLPEPLFPGTREALEALRDHGLMLGIATGMSYHYLVDLLERHGIKDWFTTLQTADRVPGKPGPDMVFRALEESCTKLDETVVIGDTTYDIEMAHAAGVGSIGVSWGYHDVQELAMAGVRRIVNSREEMAEAVLEVLGHNI
ncbi:MAG: HAD-IA family hydrolase [Rhodospirillaceae bacterium]